MSSSTNETITHAVIGAVVTLVTFFLPFSPVLGGGVAGYLHGPDHEAGAKVGGLSGLFAAVPGAVLATLVAAVFIISGPGARSGVLVAFGFFVVILLLAALYGGVLGAIGGLVGAFLNDEFGGPTETDPERIHGASETAESELDPELTEFDESVDDSIDESIDEPNGEPIDESASV